MSESKQAKRGVSALAKLTPEQVLLSKRRATKLGDLTGLESGTLTGQSLSSLNRELQWKIDPNLLLLRKVCGQVVKKDPVTGVEHPVPFATVHIEDTDCSFMAFFPAGSPWHWLFPFHCHREEIGVTQTDACGRFCAWIPRFEIDWILQWRLKRRCYPLIFRKPTLADLLERLGDIVEGPWPPIPDPNPDPWKIREGVLQHLEKVVGTEPTRVLRSMRQEAALGQDLTAAQRALAQPAFAAPMPPPLPQGLPQTAKGRNIRLVASEFGLSGTYAEALSGISANRYVGPFLRCQWELDREWTPILDVPDITFRVTQDIDGNGTEETIYSEGYCDVRWDETTIPPVKLEASPIAIASPLPADSPLCGNIGSSGTTPAIVLAGLYPLQNVAGADPYFDPAAGFAVRPNRPHADGKPSSAPSVPLADHPASAPFAGTIQLYGNNQGVPEASFYRLVYQFQPPGTGLPSGSSFTPFQGMTWPLWRWVGTPGHLESKTVAPDSEGWYAILPDSDNWLPSHLLLNWPPAETGTYRIKMQFAKAGPGSTKILLATETAAFNLCVDNSAPSSLIHSIRWRPKGSASWSDPLPRSCGIIYRNPGTAIELKVEYTASALHLRDMLLYGVACDGTWLQEHTAPSWSEPGTAATSASGVSLDPYRHWHTASTDNTISRAAILDIPGTSASGATNQGAYYLYLRANSRAFNPAGGDGGYGPLDWNYTTPSPIYADDYWPFAVIDQS